MREPSTMRGVAAVVAAAAMALASVEAASQTYPARPVRFIIGFPPGGAADFLGRVVASRLSEALGQQVVVDNRGGAGGSIAAELAAKSAPDGYTLHFTSLPHVINPHLYRKVGYDAVKDFAPIAQFVSVSLVLAVHPGFPAKSVKELVDLAKAKPGEVNYASAGSGSSGHLAMELFKTMAAVDFTHIPFKGTGPLLIELIAGRVPVTIVSSVGIVPHIKGGRLRGLAVTSARRSSAVPELPTIAEAGVAGYDVTQWFGLLAPAGTPAVVVARLNGEVNKLITLSAVKDVLAERGADPVGGTAADFGALLRREHTKWAKVVRDSGAKVD
ncbi:MAG: tripartite tricarboxylate transporter substrate binding protein [Betaproteobacteria bacterium]|nr:tripartite tricarboxylate transporter substrate binding protein [Betaproteobacteria bacterium]